MVNLFLVFYFVSGYCPSKGAGVVLGSARSAKVDVLGLATAKIRASEVDVEAATAGRQLAHRSFQTPKWLEYILAYCGVLAVQVRGGGKCVCYTLSRIISNLLREQKAALSGFITPVLLLCTCLLTTSASECKPCLKSLLCSFLGPYAKQGDVALHLLRLCAFELAAGLTNSPV
eukprot:1152173-Pelagomonas_calceolata.AAC.5